MKPFKLGFIGSGNMATAILKGILENELVKPSDIIMSDISNQQTIKMRDEYKVNTTIYNREVVQFSDIIILAIKPNICAEVLNEIGDLFDEGRTLISIVAGWTTTALRQNLPDSAHFLRVMPNTPLFVNEGAIAFSKDNHMDVEHFEFIKSIFETIGKVEMVEEKWMDGVTAISGSGPAYVYMFIEALADAGVLQGLPRDLSYRLAAQTVLGSAKMVLETGIHPGILKDTVCSPGGTTIEAVFSLEQNGFRGIIMEAVGKCADKSKILSKIKQMQME